jgi:hypothetical protein
MRLDAEENGQIGGLDFVSDARDAGNAASTAQSGYGFPKAPPSAIFFAVPYGESPISSDLNPRTIEV